MDALWGALTVAALLGLYALPSLYAAVRKTSMLAIILVLNLVLGWTGIGWFAALALAVLLPPAAARTPAAGILSPASGSTADPLAIIPPSRWPDFVIDPTRVAAFSLIGPIVFQYWWLWRFVQLAREDRFPRARSFWWVFVPFYGYAVIGRMFHDLDPRLGTEGPAGFNPQVALALLVSAGAGAGVGLRLGLLPFIVGGLGLSCVFTGMALYQVQLAVNSYLALRYPGAARAGLFPGEAIAVVASLAVAGLLALGGASGGRTAGPRLASVQKSNRATTPGPTRTPTATPSIPSTGDLLAMSSEPGDFIGQGRATVMTPPGFRFSGRQQNGPDSISVMVETAGSAADPGWVRWIVEMAGPRGQALKPGTYDGARPAAFRPDALPGIDVFGDGRGCNQVFGSFTITQLAVDTDGTIQRLDATFEQHCERSNAPALRGHIRIGRLQTEQTAGVAHAGRPSLG